jgi:hypothetical protein
MTKRDAIVSVYLSDLEKTKLEGAADSEGLSLAAYVRRLVLNAMRDIPTSQTEQANKDDSAPTRRKPAKTKG